MSAQPQRRLPLMTMGRPCGPCTLCCTAMPVPELDKPAGVPCTHLSVNRGSSEYQGCSIYGQPERPQRCSDFDCGWWQGLGREYERPDSVGVAVGPEMPNGDGRLWAIPGDFTWKRAGFVRALIDRILSHGKRCHIIQGSQTTTFTPPKEKADA